MTWVRDHLLLLRVKGLFTRYFQRFAKKYMNKTWLMLYFFIYQDPLRDRVQWISIWYNSSHLCKFEMKQVSFEYCYANRFASIKVALLDIWINGTFSTSSFLAPCVFHWCIIRQVRHLSWEVVAMRWSFELKCTTLNILRYSRNRKQETHFQLCSIMNLIKQWLKKTFLVLILWFYEQQFFVSLHFNISWW